MSVSFREELIQFLLEASRKDESYYGYINPHLLCETVSALNSTSTNEKETESLEKLSDWANEYWGW